MENEIEYISVTLILNVYCMFGELVFLDFPRVKSAACCILKKVNYYDIKIWQEERKKVMHASTHTNVQGVRGRDIGRERGRLADKGWHVPMSINSLERLIVRNKALYTSHSDKQRSTGATRQCVCTSRCVCVSKFYSAPFPQVPTGKRHPPEILPKHLISICTLSLSLFSTLLPSLFSLHFFLKPVVLCPPRLHLLHAVNSFFWRFLKPLGSARARRAQMCISITAEFAASLLLPSPLFTLWSFYNSLLLSAPRTLLWFHLARLPVFCSAVCLEETSEQVDVHGCLTCLTRMQPNMFRFAWIRTKFLSLPDLKSLTP